MREEVYGMAGIKKGIAVRAAIAGSPSAGQPPPDGKKVAKFYFVMKNVQKKATTPVTVKTPFIQNVEAREQFINNTFESHDPYEGQFFNSSAESIEGFQTSRSFSENSTEVESFHRKYETNNSDSESYSLMEPTHDNDEKAICNKNKTLEGKLQSKDQNILQFEEQLASLRSEIGALTKCRRRDSYRKLEELQHRIDELSRMIQNIKENSQKHIPSLPCFKEPKFVDSSCQTTHFSRTLDEPQKIWKHECLKPPENTVLGQIKELLTSVQDKINQILTYVPYDDLFITVQPQDDNHNHINICSNSSGEVLYSCLANEIIMNQAHRDGVFLKYLTFFIAGKKNSMKDKHNILKRSLNWCKKVNKM